MIKKFAWLDCDPGHDDALAIAILTAGEALANCKLIGMSTVGGNADLTNCTANARKMLILSKYDKINVYPGARQPLIRKSRYAPDVHGETGLDGTSTLGKIKLPKEKFSPGSAI